MSSRKVYRDSYVSFFMRRLDPVKRRHLENVLFSNNPPRQYPQIISPLLQETFKLAAGDSRPTVPYSKEILSKHVLNQQYNTLQTQYEKIINRNAILILVNDKSRTISDVNYQRKILNEIKNLDIHIESRDVHFSVLNSVFKKDSALLGHMFSNGDTYLKLISIPIRSINHTNEILDILSLNSSYEVLSVTINRQNSPLIAKELAETLTKDTTKEQINYESLMRQAKQGSQNSHRLTKILLTKIGELGQMKVLASEEFVSFIRK